MPMPCLSEACFTSPGIITNFTMHLEMSPDNLLFFCSVTASAAAGFCLFSLYRRLARRCHVSAAAPAGGLEEEEDCRQPITVASTVPAFMYDRLVQHSGKGASWTECAVCLGVIHVGAMVKLLPVCAHIYHVDCIDLWLSSHPTCPLCRCRVDHPGHPAQGHETARQLAQLSPA